MRTTAMVLAATAILIASAHGQGFLNLDFESAYNLPANPPEPNGSPVPVANALPDWAAYDGSLAGGLALSDVYYVSNYFFGAASAVELEGGTQALSGNFSVALFGTSSISQTGLVPDNAESLQFESTGHSPDLEVTLGGQNLSYSLLSGEGTYSTYEANIPAGMNGQMEQLAFLFQGGAGILLDNIEFSSASAPEPSEWALIGFGVMVFGLSRFRPGPQRGVGPKGWN